MVTAIATVYSARDQPVVTILVIPSPSTHLGHCSPVGYSSIVTKMLTLAALDTLAVWERSAILDKANKIISYIIIISGKVQNANYSVTWMEICGHCAYR